MSRRSGGGSPWTRLTGSGAGASAALGLLVLGCVFVAVAVPRAGQAVRTRALRTAVAGLSPLARSVEASTGYGPMVSSYPGPLTVTDIRDAGRQLRRGLTRQGLPLGTAAADWQSLTFPPAEVKHTGPGVLGPPGQPQMELAWRDAIAAHARFVAGRMPGSSSVSPAATTLEGAVSQATAARFGLSVGHVLTMAPGIRLVITGIFRPLAPQSAFWEADSVAARPDLISRPRPLYWLGAVLVGQAEVATLERRGDVALATLTWDYPLAVGHLDAAAAPHLAAVVSGAEQRGGLIYSSNHSPVTLGVSTSGLTTALGNFAAQDSAVGSVLSLLYISLAAIAAVVIMLGAQLLDEHRSAEFTVRRARGASVAQLARLALRGAAVVALPAAAAGFTLAIWRTPRSPQPWQWWLAGLTVLVALAAPPLLAVRQCRAARHAASRTPAKVAARRGQVRRLVTEAALVGAAAGGLVVLRQQGLQATGSAPAGSTAAYAAAAPVLVAIAAAVLLMRCYPPVVRGALRLARVRRGVTSFVGLARAARSSLTAALPVFALVLALAVVTFGVMVHSAIARGEIASSWRQTGADAVVTLNPVGPPLKPAELRAIAAVRGVRHASAVTLTAGTVPSGRSLPVVLVTPASYAALASATPFPVPARALTSPGGSAAGQAIPAMASPPAASVIGRAGTTMVVGSTSYPVRVAAVVARTPAAPSGGFVVLPEPSLRGHQPQPTLVLVTGLALDSRRLAAVVRRLLPGSSVTLRSTALAALAGAALPRGAYLIYAEGVVAAAGLALLIVLITLVLGARTRELTLARLATMGLSRRQARWLLIAEAIPLILAAAVGGSACATAMAPLIGPSINLSPFTGSTIPVPITTEPAVLGIGAGFLIALALLTMIIQTRLARRGGTATRALRVGQ